MITIQKLAAQIAALTGRVNGLANNVNGCLGSSTQVDTAPWNQTSTWVDYLNSDWPAFTFTVPPSGAILVMVNGDVNGPSGGWAYIGWRISGTDTRANAYGHAFGHGSGGNYGCKSRYVDGLTPGATDTITPTWLQSVDGTSEPSSTGQLIVMAA